MGHASRARIAERQGCTQTCSNDRLCMETNRFKAGRTMAKYEIIAVSTTAVVTSAQKPSVSCLLNQRQVGHRYAQDCEVCSTTKQVKSASSQMQVKLGGLTEVVALGHRLGDCIASEDQGSHTLDDEH